MKTDNFRSAIDAYVNEADPDNNYGKRAWLKLDGTAGARKRAYIWFRNPFEATDFNTTVVSIATLALILGDGWSGGPHEITVAPIWDAWKEQRISWDDAPAVGSGDASLAVTGGVTGQEIEIDVTTIVQEAASGESWYGLRLEVDTNGDKTLYSSDSNEATEDREYKPRLHVEWHRGSPVPTDLKPNDQITHRAKPFVQWTADDAEGEESQTDSQVQISTDDTFATTNYDSGWQANDLTEWEVPDADAFSATPLTEYFWRVRTKSNGRISAWSDIASFTRKRRGTLTIDNPPAAPAEVEEITPSIVTTFTPGADGGTKKSIEYTLKEANADGDFVTRWNRDRTKDTDNPDSFTLPEEDDDGEQLIRHTDRDYKIVVKVWDNLDRAELKGDSDSDKSEHAYVKADRVFRWVKGAIDPVTNLLATQDGPGYHLTWDRALTPDYFSIEVDDEVIKGRLDPEELRVDANSYAYDLYSIVPDGEHTISVAAVVNTGGKLKHSQTNPTVTVDLQVEGIWIVVPSKDKRVQLRDREEPRLRVGEDGETHFVQGRRKPIRIVGTIRGLEGSVGGKLLAGYGEGSAREQRDRLLTIKGYANRFDTRLIMRGLNAKVELGEVSPNLWGQIPAESYRVEVEVIQVGSFNFETKV